jgi:biotin transport system permease protein
VLSYEPGETLAHGLDPRSKLGFQVGFAVAAFAVPGPAWLGGAYALAGACLFAARLSPVRVLREYRVVLAFLSLAPLLAGVVAGSPWVRLGPALDSLVAVGRVPPVLAVSAVYVATTPLRETRAAIQRVVPGRPGQLLGVGVSLVFRFFPLVVRDVGAVREAVRARAGDRRPLRVRVRILSVRSIDRSMARADRLAVALRARCFAWNPTLPPLAFGTADYPVLAVGLGLALAPLVRLVA